MLKRVMLALPILAFVIAPSSADQLASPLTTFAATRQPASSYRSADVYYLNHPLNVGRSIQTARFMALRDDKLLFPATNMLAFDLDGWVSDYKVWVDRNITPNRAYYFVTEQSVWHEFSPESWAKHTSMYCQRENLSTHEVVYNYCNFRDMLTRLEYKECEPAQGCTYHNPWGTRSHTATMKWIISTDNAGHTPPSFAADQSVRARNPCMRARFLNPFSNPAWQSLHLTNWYKGTTGIVDVFDHTNEYLNLDTIGMNSVSSSEAATCNAAG